MLKRLNFIKDSLDSFDPIKMKKDMRKKIEKNKEERIYELWKSDIRNTNVKDLAVKIELQSKIKFKNDDINSKNTFY